MVNTKESIAVANAQIQDEWFLKSTPRTPSVPALWTISAVVAAPLSLAAGFVATGRPEDGAYALPFVAIAAFKILRDLFAG